jgi:uncharacterized protein (AIM24 family)
MKQPENPGCSAEGESMFLTTLQGHGKVWLQLLPFARGGDGNQRGEWS